MCLQGFVLRPGHENLIAMSAVNTIADQAIRDVPATKRNCYFQASREEVGDWLQCDDGVESLG